MHYCDYSSLAVISACRHCPQGPQEHSQGTLLHLWQLQVSFPATTVTATPTNHTHKPWRYFSCVTVVIIILSVVYNNMQNIVFPNKIKSIANKKNNYGNKDTKGDKRQDNYDIIDSKYLTTWW